MSTVLDARPGILVGRPLGPRGLPPEHQWDSYQIRFRNPDGTWGDYVNLLGPTGPLGADQVFAHRAQAAAATINVVFSAVVVMRYAADRELAPAWYKQGTSAGPMAFQDASGVWWELDLAGGVINTHWFGVSTGASDNAPALRAAMDAAKNFGCRTVYTPGGNGDPYLLASVDPGYNSFFYPVSGVTFCGDGNDTVFKVADGVNDSLNYGWLFCSPENPTLPDPAAYDYVTFRDFKVDCNGANNAGHTWSNNVIIIPKGIRPVVERVTVVDHPGSQVFTLGIISEIPLIVGGSVRNCHVYNAGDVVNDVMPDHSSIYVYGLHSQVTGNYLHNDTQSSHATGIEVHGGGVVANNVVDFYSKGANVCAESCNAYGFTITGNKWSRVGQAIQFWAKSDFILQGVLVTGNTGTQSVDPSDRSFYDLDSAVDTGYVQDVTFTGNSSTAQHYTPSSTGSGLRIGKVESFSGMNNQWTGFSGRGVELGTIRDGVTSVSIIGDTITDCGKTSNTSFQQGMSLNSGLILSTFIVDYITIKNVAGTFMTTGIRANAPVANGGRIANLFVSGIATPMTVTSLGIAPVGFAMTTPSLPAGTGSGNKVTNTSNWPVNVYQVGGTNVVKSDIRGTAVGIGNPTTVRLDRGESIFFLGVVPTAWTWEGL
jgi:hypothetical protein